MISVNFIAKALKTLEITPQVGCPNDCAYCPQERLVKAYAKRGGKRRISLADFKKFLDRIPVAVRLDWAGYSEPAVHPDFIPMVLLAHRRGFKQTVFTTGINLKPADIRAIARIRFDYFVFHVPDSLGYTKIKIDQRYQETLKQVIKSRIHAQTFVGYGLKKGVDVHPRLEKILANQPIKKLNLVSRGGNVRWRKIKPIKKVKGPLPICQRLTRNMLLPNGEVSLCCMDWSLKHILGNILQSDYQFLWSGSEFKKILRGLEDDAADILCRYCEINL